MGNSLASHATRLPMLQEPFALVLAAGQVRLCDYTRSMVSRPIAVALQIAAHEHAHRMYSRS